MAKLDTGDVIVLQHLKVQPKIAKAPNKDRRDQNQPIFSVYKPTQQITLGRMKTLYLNVGSAEKLRYDNDCDFYYQNFFDYEQGNSEPIVFGRMRAISNFENQSNFGNQSVLLTLSLTLFSRVIKSCLFLRQFLLNFRASRLSVIRILLQRQLMT